MVSTEYTGKNNRNLPGMLFTTYDQGSTMSIVTLIVAPSMVEGGGSNGAIQLTFMDRGPPQNGAIRGIRP